MCKAIVSVRASADNKTTVVASGPIFDVDDERFKLATPEMQRRRRILAVLAKKLPVCTGHVGERAPFKQGLLKSMQTTLFIDGRQNTCADVNTMVMMNKEIGVGASGNWGSHISSSPAFVAFQEGRRPSVGDTYNLYGAEDGQFHHCGIICRVPRTPDDFWVVADGGQPFPEYGRDGARLASHREAGYILIRTFHCEDTSSGHRMRINHYTMQNPKGGGHVLPGWLDVGHPSVRFKNDGAYDKNGSEQDYLDFAARIRDVTRRAPDILAFYQNPSNPTFRPANFDDEH